MTSTYSPPLKTSRALPKGPVFGWSSFRIEDAAGIPSVEDLPYTAFTTSGRAAIYQALLQLRMPAHSTVLVPTYHCPTMIAPVLLAGHRPAYFGIKADGLPDLDGIGSVEAQRPGAMIVSHYFGLAQSLREVRDWCDMRGIALIEDCAHCYFGQAGERPVGAWGDFCTASLSKFFPVPEAGLLGSAHRNIHSLQLIRPTLRAEIKSCVDVLETATRYRRLKGLNYLLTAISGLKQRKRSVPSAAEPVLPDSEAAMMESCDMERVNQRPLAASMLLRRILPRGRIIAQRQRNFALFARLLGDLSGARALMELPKQPVAPYVFPLWVDDADRVYHVLRTQGLPVFRWDRIWPGTSATQHDVGPDWSQHVLQLLCHQDLLVEDIQDTAHGVLALLQPS